MKKFFKQICRGNDTIIDDCGLTEDCPEHVKEDRAFQAKDLQDFLDKNKPAYFEMMSKYTDLFNKIGKDTNNEAVQLAFTGTVIYNLLNSIKCEKRQKQRLLTNILSKI